MIKKLLCRKSFFLVTLCIFSAFLKAYCQNFERVESIAGLGILEENNGVAVADYDGDNDLDIFVVAKSKDNPDSPKTISRLFRNNNDGSFTDVTVLAGFDSFLAQDEGGNNYLGLNGNKSAASWGDYDNDGFPDLFLTYSFKVQLWRNLGNGTFSNVTEITGFNQTNECRNIGSTWFDYNNDSLLDIYINDWGGCGSNQLYRNNGNGTFSDVTISTGIEASENLYSYMAIPFDFNVDGFMDLYVSNDLDAPNNLYINNEANSFMDQAEIYGADSRFDDMGMTVGDYNNDGFFDFYITAIDKNILLTNNGDNTFTDLSEEKNVNDTGWSWGTVFSDFDLDGDEDLFVVNGYVFEGRGPEPNFYYRNLNVQGQETFEDASAELGLNEETISVAALNFDYDNDGDMDLFVTNNDRASYFYENKILNFDDAEHALHWFKVDLEGTISNRDAIGSIVTLTTTRGAIKRYYSGIGFLNQSLQPLHFGLNDATEILSLEIKWPSGLVETFNDLPSDIIIKAIEGQGYTVLDILPSQKIYGCTDSTSCSYNPNATVNDGSCSYLGSQTIVGNTSSSFLRTETYTYNIAAGSLATWQVTGGEIIDGQGTNTISVKWMLEEFGRVAVTETDNQCSSLQASLDVSLDTDNLPEDISIARLWNEALLEAIRNDFARPTIHARNLFHTSVAMYDIWAIYNGNARPYLIGNSLNGFTTELNEFIPEQAEEESQNQAISYAMYRLLSHRFRNSPRAASSQAIFDLLMNKLGYDTSVSSLSYELGNAAAFGNYVAQAIIDYGLQDGSRESTGYDNAYYAPVNEPYVLDVNTNSVINDPNRWQPLALDIFIDQGGNVVDTNAPAFLSPEWGNVYSFALTEEDKITYQREGNSYHVFHDPSQPPFISLIENNASSDAYKWGFSMVSVWQSHLDSSDGVLIDISPNSIGNVDINTFPTSYTDYPNFYNFFEGGSQSNGHALNPVTGSPYETNIVPRGDYGRVLAEFWADGPDSETPPGHWFTILNYVSDHAEFEKRFKGEGPILEPLEWDVKTYFILGGGMHDAAISAWSVKGWYDYIRPISAIRAMAQRGQSTDMSLDNYDIAGMPLINDYIEVVEPGDPLAGFVNQNVGKIKLYTWKGHDFIGDTEVDEAGVGWILAEDWYPYQRPTFVTPPFAGYVSGHSTFSRAAAELMTMMTGSAFFPGGLGEFVAKKNEFLVFEEGPSQDVKLQWATYRDASDQTSLSRIWGGIHPPADDIPGRFIGQVVAEDTFSFAVPYFENELLDPDDLDKKISIYPNPTKNRELFITNTSLEDIIMVFDIRGRKIDNINRSYNDQTNITSIKLNHTAAGLYMLSVNDTSQMIIVQD